MTFIREEVPKEDLHPYHGFWYLNNNGRPMGIRVIRTVDYERNIFLVRPGSGATGTELEPSRYVLKMDGLYIDFLGMFFREEQYPQDYSLPGNINIWQLHIPMNWVPRTMEIINILKQAMPIVNGNSKGMIDDSKLIFSPPAYTPAAWCLDSDKGLILEGFGKDIENSVDYKSLLEAWYAFSQGERNPDTLYNFRLWYGDWPVDFQAWYRLDDNGPVWEIIEAAVPEDLAEHTAALVAEIPGALSKFSAIAEIAQTATVDAGRMQLVAGPAISQREKFFGAKFYPSKYWPEIPAPWQITEKFVPALKSYFQPEVAND